MVEILNNTINCFIDQQFNNLKEKIVFCSNQLRL